jgi:hypothetical protein
MITDYSELILCMIFSSAGFNHHNFIRHNHIILFHHSICKLVSSLFYMQFIAKDKVFNCTTFRVVVYKYSDPSGMCNRYKKPKSIFRFYMVIYVVNLQ